MLLPLAAYSIPGWTGDGNREQERASAWPMMVCSALHCIAMVCSALPSPLQVLLAVGGRLRVARALRGRLRLSWHYLRRMQVWGACAVLCCSVAPQPTNLRAFGSSAGARACPALP